jgi:hypothetical protein
MVISMLGKTSMNVLLWSRCIATSCAPPNPYFPCSTENFSRMKYWFHRMENYVKPNEVTYNAIMHAYAKAGFNTALALASTHNRRFLLFLMIFFCNCSVLPSQQKW